MFKLTPTILAIVFLATVVRAQGVLLRENFESSAPDWQFSGAWHIEEATTSCGSRVAPFPSGDHCAWFGFASTCSYGSGPSEGQLRLATPVQLPANATNVVLRYRRLLSTEHCVNGFDVSSVHITNAQGQVVGSSTDCAREGRWIGRRIELAPFAGETVGVTFKFSTGDNKFNETLGWWVDDVEIVREPGSILCTASADCPCANQSSSGAGHPNIAPNEDSGGCKHASLVEGRLFGNGTPSVSGDTVSLVLNDLPSTSQALYVQGAGVGPSSVFGDGRMCLGGPFVRLAVHGLSNGRDRYPHPNDAPLSVQGAVPALGATRVYQVIYRDAAAHCTASTFNVTNAYTITWRP